LATTVQIEEGGLVVATRGSAARVTVLRIIIVVSGVSIGVVLIGGSVEWLIERDAPRGTLGSRGMASGGRSPL